MAFARQTWALTKKNLLIIVRRHWFSSLIRAVILPLAYILLISFVRLFFLPPSVYGFGEVEPIRTPAEAFASQSSRSRVVLINNDLGGDIETAISSLSSLYGEAGADVRFASTEADLASLCRSSLTGTSRCYGAVSFLSSPSQGSGATWSYTAYTDWGLGLRVNINNDDNDAQVYGLPFIHAIDSAIANTTGAQLPQDMLQMPFTSETLQEREDQVQRLFMSALERYLALVIFLAVCGITYHLPGHVARERELGMASLIDTMNPQRHQWLSSTARILSTNIAFNLLYLPGTIGVAGIIAGRIFFRSSAGMQILFHILMCFSLAAYSNFFATFFRKAQLSGITIVIFSCLLSIIAQWAVPAIDAAQATLAILFPPINYTLWTIYLADNEGYLEGANFSQTPSPYSSNQLPGYFFLVAALVQIFLFLALTLLAERLRYGTTSSARKAGKQLDGDSHALKIHDFSRTYKPGVWARLAPWKRAESVHAVTKLNFEALRGQLVALLGENGSGKTTTISAITAQERVTSGTIELDGTGGLGFCPQKNVLWDELTVLEHVRIFNQLKCASRPDGKDALLASIKACDLGHKLNAKTKTLSGGQKRKVQLAMAFTGGSKVCCVDEASSGLDPVSRRKIWDILLSERGHRTILFTSHALDEADALSDYIVILQKGRLKMEGSAVELKQRHGGDYQVHVRGSLPQNLAVSDGIRHEVDRDDHIFHIPAPDQAGKFIAGLEKHGINDYEIQGPTIEQVFLRQAEQPSDQTPSSAAPTPAASRPQSGEAYELDTIHLRPKGAEGDEAAPQLAESRPIGFFGQVWVLFRKRLAIFPRNWVPYFFAVLIPIITAGLATSFLSGFAGLDCSPDALAVTPFSYSIANFFGSDIPVGPASAIESSRLEAIFGDYTSSFISGDVSELVDAQDTYQEWDSYIRDNFRFVQPGGYWLGDQASPNETLAYRIDGGLQYGAALKAGVDAYLLNTSISSRFSNFALPLAGSTGDSLQLVIYFGLAMSIWPGLLALYPSFERTRNIKALQYSNGVRPAPFWLAHLLFDSIFVVLISSGALAIFSSIRSEVWFSIGHLWPVCFFFGLSATLFAYIASLFLSTQLGAFAFAAGFQALTLVLYFFIYLLLVAFSVADTLVDNLVTVQFTLGLITPSGNLLRTLLLGLNQSQILCDGQTYRSPSSMAAYGGPIFLLILQIVLMYAFLVSYDSGHFSRIRPYIMGFFKRTPQQADQEKPQIQDTPADVLTETNRTENSPGDALRVLHLSKAFSRNQPVVSDLTFGVQSSESFALLGPNGAGKTTTISLIRGHLKPTTTPTANTSDILIDGHSLTHNRSSALLSQGVCPQFDAIDMLTVTQHLQLYARAAGIPRRSINSTVTYIMQAVGLTPYARRLAATLSGGNKRKLSLAIAVVGNPKVLLLDEPSSGMDAVSKRIMWRALDAVKRLGQGRSMAMVITSHSMEEVSALSDRVGIMKKHMLAVGEKGDLIRRFGDRYHVHVMLRGDVVGNEAAEKRVREWIEGNVPGAVIEREMLHGQLRFWVPRRKTDGGGGEAVAGGSGLVGVFSLLEANKEALGIEYYSVVQTNLEDVFLNVVGQEEEG